jgi:integrase
VAQWLVWLEEGVLKNLVKLTKRSVEALARPEKGAQHELWDKELGGFHVRALHGGRRVYRFKYRRPDGRQVIVTLGDHGPLTAEIARERAMVLAGAVAEGRDPSAEKLEKLRAAEEERRRGIVLAELAERWLAEGRDAAPNKRERSWATDASCLRRHILPLIGKVAVRDLTKGDIERAQRAIAAGKTAKDEKTGFRGRAIVRGGAGIARRSLAALSSCLSWAVDQEIISTNPVARVKKLPQNQTQRFLSEAEAARLLDTMTKMEAECVLLPVFADCVRVLLLTGARRSEIANLAWDEVDLGRGLLSLAPGRHKAGGSAGAKHIVLNAPAAAVIASRPRVGLNVFPAPTDPDKGCNASLAKAWQRIRQRADLTGLRLHDLRHSYASFGAAGGASLILIGKALGHSQSQTTQRYVHLANDPLRDLAEKVGNRIMGAESKASKQQAAKVMRLPQSKANRE